MATPGMVASLEWTDGKCYLWMLGALPNTLPIIAAVSALATGWHPLWWAGPFIVFTIIPLLDFLIGDDRDNPPEDVVPVLEKQRYYRRIVYPAAQCVGDDGGVVGRVRCVRRAQGGAVPDHPGHLRRLAAGGGELPGALRPVPPAVA